MWFHGGGSPPLFGPTSNGVAARTALCFGGNGPGSALLPDSHPGRPHGGGAGRLLTYLWMALAAMMVAVQGEAGALLTAFLLLVVQVVAALRLDWKNVRCSNCGKHLPLFGDMDRCSACRTAFPA